MRLPLRIASLALIGVAMSGSLAARAESATVLINEFMPDPLSGGEWAELYNPGPLAVAIGGWQIDDDAIGRPGLVIAAGTQINPGEYLVITWATNILNKTGDSIQLIDSIGAVVDSHSYANAQSDLTLARIPDGGLTWAWGDPTGGAPNAPAPTATPTGEQPSPAVSSTATAAAGATPTNTSTAMASATAAASATNTSTATASATATPTEAAAPTAAPAFGAIRISEIAAGADPEWVEILNSGDLPVNLDGWQITRVSSAQTTARAWPAVTIAPGARAVASFAKGFLPNDGATITLHNGAGAPMGDPVIYPSLDATHVYALMDDDTWLVTDQISQGEPNPTPAPTATASPTTTPTDTRTPSPTRTESP
ncbi:MAG: lamin tail domain-containing protein, partial [Chloroflexales bacterium]